MIKKNKEAAALKSINYIFVLLRHYSSLENYEGFPVILDCAEYLPLLMLDPEDKTEEFRETLIEICKIYPNYNNIIKIFDQN
ncbi:hypothetical protein KKF34_14505 [Myxococcota bacterium]|nr:hypothetical protein [Myxococcota bacterium]MBU1383150.1 hypothetical protein [Myxococcota bacterium]MBU1498085.1 hypothetical protein [Myxococcota bacterium]